VKPSIAAAAFALGVAAAVALAAAAPASPAAAGPCAGSDLTGSFDVIPGSAGAGNISYRLSLVNASPRRCFVSGIPQVRLLGKAGQPLPTAVSPARPGVATAAKVELAPGASAVADARFSPDVPGVGEGGTGQCEPTAYSLRVTAPGGGSLKAKVTPPTPVCEHGALSFSLLRAGPAVSYAACLRRARTQEEIGRCTAAEERRVDALLNSTYRRLLASRGVDRAKLIAAEKRWIAFRDADCAFARTLRAGGTLASVEAGKCLVDRTTQRTAELRRYLKQVQP